MKRHYLKFFSVVLCAMLLLAVWPTTAFAAINFNSDYGSGANITPTIYIGQAIGPNPIRVVAAGNPAASASLQIDTLNLPTGLTIQDGAPGPGTRDIWGTAGPGTVGSYISTFTDTTDSFSGTLTIIVAAGPQTIVQSDISKAIGDANFQLTPHSTNANGATISGTDTPTYTYGGGNASVATIDASGNVTIVGLGTTTFTIDSAANGSYQAATQKVVNITVNKAAPTLTLSAAPPAGQAYPGNVVLTASLTGADTLSGKTITFTINGTTQTATTDASGVATYTITSPGADTYTFDASFAGDANNNAATATAISGYVVGKGTQAVLTITGGDISKTFGDADFQLTTTGGSGTGGVSYTVTSGSDVISITGDTVTILKAGTATVTATRAGDANYNPTTSAPITITVTAPPPVKYPVLTHFGTWTGTGTATAKVDADHPKFTHLTLNGATVDLNHYTITPGSTVITLGEVHLNTLANGTYTYIAHFTDGSSEAITLTVNRAITNPATGTPQTGDTSLAGIGAVLLLSALGSLCLFSWRRRKAVLPGK